MESRTFETGATRDTDQNKFDYEAFLSPQVLARYAAYMHKHRKQTDGKLRDGDNWQKLFGKDHYAVCMKSMWRHFMDIWFFHRKMAYMSREPIEEALCALLFNTMAFLFKILNDKQRLTKGDDSVYYDRTPGWVDTLKDLM